MRLATLLAKRLTIAAKGGANATAKVLALVAGMVGGADSIARGDGEEGVGEHGESDAAVAGVPGVDLVIV